MSFLKINCASIAASPAVESGSRNAIEYAASEVQVRLDIANEEKAFQLIIQNDGYLIPAEMKEKVFEPFFQMKEDEKLAGTGIGLSLSKSLTELHKGKLELSEAVNNIYTFVLTLPMHQEIEFDLRRT